jgi:glycyl-tRNA synthetase beta chain
MSELLIEIFSEEIPARMQVKAVADFSRLLSDSLKIKGMSHNLPRVYVTPRRLVAMIEGLVSEVPGTIEERRGPKVGAPDAALQGFLKSVGLSSDKCRQNNGYWYADIVTPAQKTMDIIPDILESILTMFPWPKSMRWPEAQHAWVRPVRSILCLFDGQPLTFFVKSMGIETGNKTYGHRFMAPEELVINSIEDYQDKLEKAFVILDHQKRQDKIKDALTALCHHKELQLQVDEDLLSEVAGLVEYPVAFLGKIDQEFMVLPKVVLSTSMRVHQKYFTVVNKDGTIAPFFGVIANRIPADEGKEMVRGYERVLRARLSDAAFFFTEDKKTPLLLMTPKLDAIVFQTKLGSLGNKCRRLQALVPSEDSKTAATICKADLLTHMVGEFPELQGTMGQIYADSEGYSSAVSLAIREHYQPLGPADTCPKNGVSIELALADKIDTLIGFFGIGEEPTGSKDPFALRRNALGILRLIRENALKNFRIDHWFEKSVALYQDQGISFKEQFSWQRVFSFLLDRLAVMLKGEGIPHDCVAAVIAGSQKSDVAEIRYNLWGIAERAKSLQAFLNTEEGDALQAAFRRAYGILSTEEKKDQTTYRSVEEVVLQNPNPQEQQLLRALSSIASSVPQLLKEHDFTGLMRSLATLRQPVDSFFDLKINDEDPIIRKSRLRILGQLVNQTSLIADFSQLQG